MGIKGIYQEIGNGRRVALAQLADDNLKRTGRALRLAIDASIWLYQIQASDGGSQPELRTLYYRLVRLLLLGIHAVFVFDGQDKPPLKRNGSTASGALYSNKTAKRLIKLFGYRYHNAPGEAEAECAALQRLGIVDAVLSEDVDTLAFGSTLTIRSWTAESSRGNKAPTHVTLYDANEIKQGRSGLDREGMILVALMSGGDYLPEGIPGCGTKVACEAARAGFGHDLCELQVDDETGFFSWRERLCHELMTNESGFFKTRHKALASRIPPSFPNRTVISFHAHPAVSSTEYLLEVRDTLESHGTVDVKGLRDFVDEQFNWRHLSGAKKFLRQITPALLAHKLRGQAPLCDGSRSMDEQADREERLLLGILSRRRPFNTDGAPELKVVYIPALVADFDIDQEIVEDPDSAAQLSPDEEEAEHRAFENLEEDNFGAEPIQEASLALDAPKRSNLAEWDANAPQKAWILESSVSLGAPLSLERWTSEMEKIGRQRESNKSGGMKQGALEVYLRVMKPHALTMSEKEGSKLKFDSSSQSKSSFDGPRDVAKAPLTFGSHQPSGAHQPKTKRTTHGPGKGGKSALKQQRKAPLAPTDRETNPWTLAQKRKEQNEFSYPGSR